MPWDFTSASNVQLQVQQCSDDNDIFVYAWWRHQMETFSALLAICAGNSPVPGEFPTHSWVNNREAGDLIRYRAHYDVIVMVRI